MNYNINTQLIQTKMLQNGYSLTKLASIAKIATSTLSRIINNQGTLIP